MARHSFALRWAKKRPAPVVMSGCIPLDLSDVDEAG